MKYFTILGFFFHMVIAFDVIDKKYKNIWVPFISKAVLNEDNMKKCAFNIHLENSNTLDHISILKYLHTEMIK